MAVRQSRRLLKPFVYTAAAVTVGSSVVLYISYRPRNIPGSEGAAVPPPTAEDGTIIPPSFPNIKAREQQIADLRRSGGLAADATETPLKQHVKNSFDRLRGATTGENELKADQRAGEPYDLLVIGGGAT